MEDHIAQGIKRHVIPELIADTRNLAADRAGIDSLVVVYERCGRIFVGLRRRDAERRSRHDAAPPAISCASRRRTSAKRIAAQRQPHSRQSRPAFSGGRGNSWPSSPHGGGGLLLAFRMGKESTLDGFCESRA